jgi:DNA repair exonuclease SbcCD ATPase subunit
MFYSPFTIFYLGIEIFFFLLYWNKRRLILNLLKQKSDDLTEEEFISFINFWPNFFITLGILGTFLGIIIGITNLDFGSESSLKNSINLLLSSMGTAFFSSIVGVILSIVAQLKNKLLIKLFSEFAETNKKMLLDEIIGIRNDIKEIFAKPFETISEKASQTVEQYSNSFNQLNESLNNTFEQNINRFSNIVHNISEEITNQLESIKQQSELIERREKIIQNEKEILEDFSVIIEKNKETFNEIFDKQKNIIEKLDRMNKTIQIIVENEQNLDTLNKNVLEVISNFKKFTEQFNSNFNNFISNINKITQQVPNQMILNYKKAFEEMEGFTKEFFSKFKDISIYLDDTIDDFEVALKDFNDSFYTIRDEILDVIENFKNSLVNSLESNYNSDNNNIPQNQLGERANEQEI